MSENSGSQYHVKIFKSGTNRVTWTKNSGKRSELKVRVLPEDEKIFFRFFRVTSSENL